MRNSINLSLIKKHAMGAFLEILFAIANLVCQRQMKNQKESPSIAEIIKGCKQKDLPLA
jgi:hypothetical protein